MCTTRFLQLSFQFVEQEGRYFKVNHTELMFVNWRMTLVVTF
jgi:hypothetical protein